MTKTERNFKKYWNISVTEKHVIATNVNNIYIKLTRAGKFVESNLHNNEETRKTFDKIIDYANKYILKK
jgi:hypothetical protein